MKEFVGKAHSAGLKVYLDVVPNHTGDLISYKEGESYVSLDQYPYRTKEGKKFNSVKIANSKLFPTLDQLSITNSFPKQVVVNQKIMKSPDWLNDPRNYHNRGNSGGSGESSIYGDFYGLDDLFTESPAVLDGWVEVFGKWISDIGVDGFRVDTFRHVNHEFWLQFLPKMREIARNSGKTYFPMWAEIYDSDPGRISDWIKRSDLQEVLDFPIQNSITGFILDEEAKQRQHTLIITMQAIIDHQKNFFITGDETALRPMILRDIAEKTDLDISTISRVANSKFVQTEFGSFRLKHFFSESLSTDSGEEVSTREVKTILQEFIDAEDKHNPLSDDVLTEMLQAKGYNIARRTVAKYREMLNIPVARLRKEL